MPQARTSPRYGPEGRTLHAEHTLDRVCKKAEGAVPAPPDRPADSLHTTRKIPHKGYIRRSCPREGGGDTKIQHSKINRKD